MKRTILAAALLVCGAAQASFTGPFAPGNWTQVLGTGAVNVFDAVSLSLTSGNDGSGSPSNTDVTIVLTAAGTVSFDWQYSTNDEGFGGIPPPFFDPFFALEPAVDQLTSDTGSNSQSGTHSFPANAAATIGFRIRTLDNFGGAATVRISNFCFNNDCGGTNPVPEPGGPALLGAALLAGVATRRRLKSTGTAA